MRILEISIVMVCALAAGMLAACGDDGDGGRLDLSGDWTFTVQMASSGCGEVDPSPEQTPIRITQDGDELTLLVVGDDPYTLDGTLDGDRITISGQVPLDDCDGGGQTSISGNGQGSESRIEGTLQVTFSPDIETCAAGSQCQQGFSFTLTR